MQSEAKQTQRTNTVGFQLYEVSGRGKFLETESRLEVTRGWEKREREITA